MCDMNDQHYQAIVIGAGPAGLTAGIYLSRSRVKTLIINEGAVGGQMVLTHEIANYPGVEKISGYQLASVMKKQALAFGCEIRSNVEISAMELSGERKSIHLADGRQFTSDVVIIATGGRSRMLNVAGEKQFKGRGISYCATCDGDFFTGKEIVVVGGGNSALEEAVSLTKYATKVTVVHQFDHFQAFEYAVEEARSNPKIHFIMDAQIIQFNGQEKLESVDIKHTVTGAVSNLKTDGVFIFIGYAPNTESLQGVLQLNNAGEIMVNDRMETSLQGVFAAGDSIAKKYRQVTTAVGDATVAALSAAAFLHEMSRTKKAAWSN